MKKNIFYTLFFISFVFSFPQEYFLTMVDNLRVRSSQDLKSKVITKLNRGELLNLIKVGKTIETDGIKANWYYVSTKSKIKGWVFGGYLSRFKKISQKKYEISYPEVWTFREEIAPTFTYIQISDFDTLKDSKVLMHGYIPKENAKIEIYIYNNINKSLENWLSEFDNYNNKQEETKIQNGVKIKIKDKYMGYLEYTYILKNNTGFMFTYFPIDSVYKKICENVIESFQYKK